jgi:hypothetical protein
MRRSMFTLLQDASTDCVATTADLKSVGVAATAIVRECGAGGSWQRMLPGVVLLHNGPPTVHQRLVSALRYAGTEAQLTGQAALNLHGYTSTVAGNILILLPQHRNKKSSGFVTVERTWRLPEPVERSGLACAPPIRATLDAARRVSDPSACKALMAHVIQRGGVTVEQLAAELSGGSDRGSALPRATLRELGKDAHSVAEIAAQKLYSEAELPLMVHNREVFDSHGHFLCKPDGWIDDLALAWEIDSLQHHLTPADHERTVLRRQRMEAAGVVVVAHMPKQIFRTPAVVLEQLRRAVLRARARPRPDVRLR